MTADGLADRPGGELTPAALSAAGAFAAVPAATSVAVGPGSGYPGAFVPPAAEHPVVAANRYRELMGASDAVRAELAERLAARQEDHEAVARRHRAAAEDIRSRVAVVWSQVGASLEAHGLDGLEQLRPREGWSPDIEAAYQRYGGELDGLDRGRGARAGVAPAGGRTSGGKQLSGGGQLSGGKQVPGAKRANRGRALDPLTGPDGLVEPERAKKLAYRLCLEVLSRSAELRAVSRGASSLSSGLIIAVVCGLAGIITAVTRVFAEAPALPCLAAAGGIGVVAVLAGGDSPTAAARSGLLAAASAGVAVLATFSFVPMEPAGTIGALACLALALRFGLGFGSTSTSSTASQGGSGRR